MMEPTRKQFAKSRLGRFGWKIIGLLLITAIVPLIAAVVLFDLVGSAELRFLRGESERARIPIQAAAGAYRQLISTRKLLLTEIGDSIAADRKLGAALSGGQRGEVLTRVREILDARPDLVKVSITFTQTVAEPIVLERPKMSASEVRALELTLPISDFKEAAVSLTFVTDREIFDTFEKLGRVEQMEKSLDSIHAELPSHYRRAFLMLLCAVVLIVLIFGAIIARRSARALSELAQATRKFAAGRDDALVDVRGKDELAELGRAWNRMVRDWTESRSRVEYLEKIGAWQEVARRLAHEIKNPLTPIQLAIQELDSTYRGDDERYRKLIRTAREIVTEEIGTLRRLVDDFSAFAKLPRVEPKPLAISALLADLIAQNDRYAERVIMESAPDVSVSGDRQLLRRVFVNLFDNALEMGDDVTVKVSVHSSDRGAEIHVADSGPGVPTDFEGKIFDPYFTTKAEGTGLGLAIVKKILLDHQGDIVFVPSATGAEQSLYKGAHFTVRLPLANGSAAPPPSSE